MKAEPSKAKIGEPLGRKCVVATGREAVILTGIGSREPVGTEAGATRRPEDRGSVERGVKKSVTSEEVKLVGELIINAYVELIVVERACARSSVIVEQLAGRPGVRVGKQRQEVDRGGGQQTPGNLIVRKGSSSQARAGVGDRGSGIVELADHKILTQVACERGIRW